MSTNKKIIGLTGRAGAGKNTAAAALLEYRELAYARPLKEAVGILFDFTHEQLYDAKEKEIVDERWGKSPRQILQWLGTDVLRTQLDENFFLIHMKSKIEESFTHYGNAVVITDVRFDNEAKLIKELGGKIVKIVREEEKEDKEAHSSEKGVSMEFIDEIIINDGTIKDLHGKVHVCENIFFSSDSKRVKEEN